MNNFPLISIIVPVYNCENYLSRCIESIINQTYKNIEIILVNDGSTDSSGAICLNYQASDNRIVYLHQENRGQSSARNAGLDVSKGEYIGFADSDDYLQPDMIEQMYLCALKHNADMVACNHHQELESGERLLTESSEVSQIFNSSQAMKSMFIDNKISAAVWDKLFSRNLIQEIRFPVGYVCEDIPFVYNCVVKAKKIVRIDLPLYVYIIRAGSVSRVVYSPRNAGMYIYPKEILIDVRKKYKENIREAEYYCFRGLLVLFFRFYKSHSKDKSIKDFKKDFYRFLPKIMFNKYLPGKYKLFAVAVFLHIQKLSLKVAERLGINDLSFLR